MAEDKTKRPGATAVAQLERRNFRRGLIVSVVALFVFGSIGLWCYLLSDYLFKENMAFILRNVTVASPSAVNSRWTDEAGTAKLSSELGLQKGVTNLFGVNLGDLRARAVSRYPGIEDVTIRRVLPDTLSLTIKERLPLAVVHFSGPDGRRMLLKENLRRRAERIEEISELLTDDKSILMSRADFARIDTLPEIRFEIEYAVPGAAVDIQLGAELAQLQYAVALLKHARMRVDLDISAVIIAVKTERLEFPPNRKCIVRFNYKGHIATAILPPSDNIEKQLIVLEEAVADSIDRGTPRATYDLRFEDRVIQR